MIVLDTGPLVAAALTRDAHHVTCARLLTEAHARGVPLVVPGPVAVEVCLVLESRAGAKVEAQFAEALASEAFTLVELQPADWGRVAELIQRYADFPLGAVDAAVVAVAERLGARQVATVDRRHFSVVQAAHGPLTLLPEKL